MKNIHVLPTDKPSRLLYFGTSKELTLQVNPATFRTFERSTQHIYITSDEEIKEGDYFLYDETEIRYKTNGTEYHGRDLCHISGNRRYPVNKSKKIILTTDQDLINDGVQKIADDFLEWFVKNPNCEEVAVGIWSNLDKDGYLYHIIIPKESKQKTLEKLAKEYYPDELKMMEMMERIAFKRGYTECEERMYSEEEVLETIRQYALEEHLIISSKPDKWFEQLKKK